MQDSVWCFLGFFLLLENIPNSNKRVKIETKSFLRDTDTSIRYRHLRPNVVSKLLFVDYNRNRESVAHVPFPHALRFHLKIDSFVIEE